MDQFDYENMFAIAEEARIETASKQEKKKSKNLFRKRFKSINHLHDSGSQVLDKPLAILLELIYAVGNKIWDTLKAIVNNFFSKPDKIFGDKVDSYIVGKISFATREDYLKPITHLRLEMWGKTQYGNWRKFAQGETDINGEFRLGFDMAAVHSYNIRPLFHFKIFETDQFAYKNGKAYPIPRLFKTIKFSKKHMTGMDYSLGHIQLFFWEYIPDIDIARVVIKDHDGDPPQKYPEERIDAMSYQFIPIEIIMEGHMIKINTGSDITLDEIQEDYPKNLTASMEEHQKGITRSDQWFAERMMNGMSSSTFDKDPKNENLYWLHQHWKSYDHDDSEYALFNVSMKFKLSPEGYMLPEEIQLRGRLHADGDPNELHTIKPTDGIRWEGAKRVARVSAGLLTEIDKHFAGTHLNTEQYAIAVYRNIRHNPIGALLFPHIKEVVLINHTAYQILVNSEGYICRSSALTGKGLEKRVQDVMGTLDWKNWKPVEVISDKHTYAKAANLYYDMLAEYVDEFIKDHKEEIVDEWHELVGFSKDLVDHSAPFFLCKHLKTATNMDEKTLTCPHMPSWFNTSNRMDLTVERPLVYEKRRAVSPIVENHKFDPESNDLENIRNACIYIIFNSTFEHFWANSKQYDDIGEFKYCSLGLRYGSTEHGVLGPEDDEEIAPNRKIASQMMWWSNMLSRTSYGFITANEEGDINPRLIELLKSREEAFEDLGVSIDLIQSRTNI